MKIWKVKQLIANNKSLEDYLNSLQKENKEIKQIILLDKEYLDEKLYNIVYVEEDLMEDS